VLHRCAASVRLEPAEPLETLLNRSDRRDAKAESLVEATNRMFVLPACARRSLVGRRGSGLGPRAVKPCPAPPVTARLLSNADSFRARALSVGRAR
jgi:hypothetical protein